MTAPDTNDNLSPAPETQQTAAVDAPQAPAPDATAALTAEIAQLKDRMLRMAADADNTRKRAARDVEEMSKYAVTGFARDMVNVSENLTRALSILTEDAKKQTPMLKVLSEGVEMTLKELLSIFERHGIKRIDPIGQKFDHNAHQAVAQIETPDAEAGTVVQVLQAGYMLHDRLLRPAMVGVAKRGEVEKKVDTTA